jgi:hypothetical protein
MTTRSIRVAILAATLLLGASSANATPAGFGLPEGKPAALVDLRTAEGVALVDAAWRYRDAQIVEIDFNAAGPT